MRLGAAREALLAETRAEAARILAEAQRQARELATHAHEEADRLVARAVAEGEAEASREAARRYARARGEARTLVLEARRELYELLREDALAAARALRGTPRYARLLERLEAQARGQLGEKAVVEVDPPEGGVVAIAGGRRVDYTLGALVERCVARHAAEVEVLWS